MKNAAFDTFVDKWVDREYLPKTVAPGPLEKAEKALGVLPVAYRQFLLTLARTGLPNMAVRSR
jgi:hypothetical protein